MKPQLFFTISILFFSYPSSAADNEYDGGRQFKITDLFHYQQPERRGDSEKKLFFDLAAGYTEKKGNTESDSATYGFSARYDDNHSVLKLNYYGSYGKYSGTVIEDKGTASANFDYFLFWRIEFFSYTMSDYDKIIFLTHRNGTGAGAKIYIIRNDYLLLDLSGAPIIQYEKYEEQPAEKEWRWSVRGRIELFPGGDDFFVRYYAYYIPAMDDKNNYRTIQDIFFLKKLAGALGIRAGYRREYNTYDEEAFKENPLLKKTDSTTYIQASLSL